MREYNSCFVGIPVPEDYVFEYSRLQADVKRVDSRLSLPDLVPHLTLLYLEGKFNSELSRVYELTSPMLPILRGQTLDIGGYGDFCNGSILFLRANSPPSQIPLLHQQLISAFSEGDSLPYIPHVTVCRDIEGILTPKTREVLVKRFDLVHWSFPIKDFMVVGSNCPQKDIVPRA